MGFDFFFDLFDFRPFVILPKYFRSVVRGAGRPLTAKNKTVLNGKRRQKRPRQ